MTRIYVRTSRRTGVSLPWPLALIVGAVWLLIMLMVLIYGAIAYVAVWLYRRYF